MIDYNWDFSKTDDFSMENDFFDEKEREDKMWQERTGLNFDSLCGAIETIIYMSEHPIDIVKIKNMIDPEMPLRVIHDSISKLQSEYENKHHGLRLTEVAEGYQFRTKATFAKYVQTIHKVNNLVLSPTSMEVLAIIAYKQPISKTDVETIRGVDSSHIIRALMDRRLVKTVGRSEDIGKPSLYGTTDEFLEVFNLAKLEDMPSETELAELAMSTTVGSISEIRQIVASGDKKRFVFDEFNELEELSSIIQNIDPATEFTKTLDSENKKSLNGEEGEVRKSAFDILEEFVAIDALAKQNKVALNSETLTNLMDAKVVDVTENDQIFNTPLSDEEISLEEAQEELKAEGEELMAKLDEAFDNLYNDYEEMELSEEDADELKESMDALDETNSQAIEMAKELDIDLNFLQEEIDQPHKDN
jgi:segregation and condensation protein B